jgi:3-oxoacyl-ACP reductase-like protein
VDLNVGGLSGNRFLVVVIQGAKTWGLSSELKQLAAAAQFKQRKSPNIHSWQRLPKNWFITGVSTGFGAALADLLLEKGDKVVATFASRSRLTSLRSELVSTAAASWLK